MTTLTELADLLRDHIKALPDVATAYSWPTITPSPLPAFTVHPGGHDIYIDRTVATFGTVEVAYSLVLYQAAGNHHRELEVFNRIAEAMPAHLASFTAAGVSDVVLLRVLEPRIFAPPTGSAMFVGQFDITLTKKE